MEKPSSLRQCWDKPNDDFFEEWIVKIEYNSDMEMDSNLMSEFFDENKIKTESLCKIEYDPDEVAAAQMGMHPRVLCSQVVPLKCSICDKIFTSMPSLNQHEKLHKTLFRCNHCKMTFPTRNLLNKHKATPDVHKPPVEYHCDRCPYVTLCKKLLTSHLHIHSLAKTFKCQVCGEFFKTPLNLSRHKLTHDGSFRCTVCRKHFPSKTQLDEHRATHRISCPECPFVGETNYTIKRHMKTHSADRSMKCEICGESFKTADVHRRHLLWHAQPFGCLSICGKRFPTRDEYEQHKTVCAKWKLGYCRLCRKRFRTIQLFDEHNATPGVHSFACDRCPYKSEFRHSLIRHMNFKHSINGTFECDACGKLFKSSVAFCAHKSSHCSKSRDQLEEEMY